MTQIEVLIAYITSFYRYFREKGVAPGVASSKIFVEMERDFQMNKSLYETAYLIFCQEIAEDEQMDTELKVKWMKELSRKALQNHLEIKREL